MLTALLSLVALPHPVLDTPLARAAELAAALIFTAVLIATARHDAATLRIPDRIIIPGTFAITATLLLATVITGTWPPFNNALAGAFGGAALYLLLHVISKGGIGFGDVKLAGLIGLLTGWHSPMAAFLAPIAAFGAAGLAVIAGLTTRQITRKTEIPLAPFMAFGAVVALNLR